MIHTVTLKAELVNSMDHIDFNYPLNLSLKSTEIPDLFSTWRIQNIATVFRTRREQQNGGFGNPDKHPNVWAVALLVDGLWARVHNTRDQGREWSNLDRLEKWLRDQGISRWQVLNDIEPVGNQRLGEAYYVPPR